MTEIAVRPDAPVEINPGQDAVARLIGWAETAHAAHDMALMLVKTSFVPAQYRDKPDEAAAAILAGAEIGIPGPLAALRAFHPINGTPTLAAMTMRAIVQSHGHDVRIVVSDDTRAEVAVRRKGDTDWQTSVWTIERAKLAGLVGGKNPNWKTNPTAMLVARATSEGCRWVASDALMGMPYSAEELQDEAAIEPPPATRRLTVAELEGGAEPTEMLTDKQRGHMFALWGELGFAGDENREQRLGITAKILGLPELESSSDLTRADADRVIAALIERKERTAGEQQ
jgi:hypothetical protein